MRPRRTTRSGPAARGGTGWERDRDRPRDRRTGRRPGLGLDRALSLRARSRRGTLPALEALLLPPRGPAGGLE